MREVLRLEQLIPMMKQALMDFSCGRVTQPVRTVLPVPEHNGRFGIMPVVYGDVMGAKLVTFYPGNAERGEATHLATIQLFRASTGEPLAVMDGRLITELRTAAVSAVASDLLAPKDVRVLAILGSGVQAHSHLQALRLVRKFEDVRVWSQTPEHAARFAESTGAVATLTAEAAVANADVVVTVTSAAEPVLRGEWLKADAYVNAVGAVGAARRELDKRAMEGTVVVDSREAAMQESGDILLAGANVYAELGELLADPGKRVPAGKVIFKSLGIAVEDIAAARMVYEALTY